MKRLSEEEKQRFAELSLKREVKRLKRKYRGSRAPKDHKQSLSKAVQRLKVIFPEAKISYKRGTINLNAPSKMRLGQSKSEVFDFLGCARSLIEAKAKQKRINFSSIEDISPMCAMLLASEVHRWQLIAQKKLCVWDAENWTPAVKQMLHDMGLFDLVDVINPVHQAPVDTVEKFIRIRSGQEVNLEKALENIEQQVSKIAIALNQEPSLYDGIAEAVTNVTQWAYGEEKNEYDVLYKRWWFFCSYNVNTGRITIMVYDHGQGIPNTLPTSKWRERMNKWADERGIIEYTDDKIIEAAMKFPRSASGEKYRAKGLKQMKNILERFDEGTLMVLSNRGEYQVNCNNDKEITRLNKHSIGGTLIAWEVYPKIEQYHD